ncbi:hypothetical protein NUW54_g13975 [Trametes sanguinea]|uniref:Uncharacterized protein n=1 Tax=Trametes sanguinea TaxID=158606 RepID=A0ACC1MFS6_9APHY|nr:hypothetical protein NUW54_g13975 [Trametes sanguinea]
MAQTPDAEPEAGASEDDVSPTNSASSASTVAAEERAAVRPKKTRLATDEIKKRKRKRQRMREFSAGEQVTGSTEVANVVDVGNDEDTVAASSPAPAADAEQADTPQKMWFESEAVVKFWAARGRKALEELGIPVEHGIER